MATATAEITKAEFGDRVKKVQAEMAKQGLDIVLNYDEDRNLGAAGVRNLIGFWQFPSPIPGIVVIPREGDPILCMQPGMGQGVLTYAEMHSNYKIYATDTPQFKSELISDICRAMADSGFSKGKVGIDGLGQMPYNLYNGLKERNAGSEFVNVTGLVESTRVVKSAAEHEAYIEAGRITNASMDAFIATVKPGLRQSLAVSAADHVALAEGAEDSHLIMAAGTPWIWGTGNRRGDLDFKEGDLVALEINARYHSYYAQIGRTFPLGTVTEERMRVIQAVKNAHEAMLSVLKPGKTGAEVFAAGVEQVEKLGFSYSGIRYGHGLGVTIGEGYDFRPGETRTIPEGAIGLCHPFIIATDERNHGTFNAIWGDPWILRADGPQLIVKS